MSKTGRILLWSLLLLLLSGAARAADVTERSFSIIDREAVEDAVPEEARELMDGEGIGPELDFAASLRRIGEKVRQRAADDLRGAFSGGVRLFAAAMLCTLAAAFSEKMGKGIRLAGTLAVTLLAAGDVQTLLGLGRETVTELAAFGKVLMPVLAAASAASGALSASGTVTIAVMFVIDVLITLFSDVMMPLVWAYAALLAAGSLTGNGGLGGLAKALKNGVTLAMKIIVGLFVGYLAASGLISGAADALAVKSVKLALSTAIPAAGSVISDAAEAVVAGAGIVRGVTGAFGVLAIVAILILPFLRIAVQYCSIRLAALLAGVAGADGLDGLIEGFGNAASMILTITGSSGLLLLIGVCAAAAGVRA